MNNVASAGKPEVLGVREVLVGSLPASLLTSTAPAKYTVAAVFTRKVERDEVAAIEGEATRRFLDELGYPEVELHVSDRRLEIRNSSLEELNVGLSTVIANRLTEIETALSGHRAAARAEAQDLADREQKRANAVAALAEAVTFVPGPVQADPTQVRDNEDGNA